MATTARWTKLLINQNTLWPKLADVIKITSANLGSREPAHGLGATHSIGHFTQGALLPATTFDGLRPSITAMKGR